MVAAPECVVLGRAMLDPTYVRRPLMVRGRRWRNTSAKGGLLRPTVFLLRRLWLGVDVQLVAAGFELFALGRHAFQRCAFVVAHG